MYFSKEDKKFVGLRWPQLLRRTQRKNKTGKIAKDQELCPGVQQLWNNGVNSFPMITERISEKCE